MSKAKWFLSFLPLVILFLVGCLPVDSLNPLYTDKDVVSDKSLLGVWVGTDNSDESELEINAQTNLLGKTTDTYVLTMRDKNDGKSFKSVTVYSAKLVDLGGRRFLDVMPETFEARAESYPLQIKSGKSGMTIAPGLLRLAMGSYMEFSQGESGGKLEAHLRRAHWFFKVNKNGDKLQLDWADDEAFRKKVESGAIHLPNALLGDGKTRDVVITASTPELQKFVLAHADDGTLFSDHMDELHRKQ
jgi:hypothetical protein